MITGEDAVRVAFPAYSTSERRVDIAMHVLGVACGIAGTLALMTQAGIYGSPLLVLGVVLYAVGLVSMFGFSAAYNLWPHSPVKEWLRRFDHAAIFVMIAGTITPFLLNRVGGNWGVGLLAVIWAVALTGMALKIVFPRRWELLSIVLYVGLGLSILIVVNRLVEVLAPVSLILLGVGAVIYIAGIAFHLAEKLPYQNAIWHFFVLAAASVHFVAVMNEVSAAEQSARCAIGAPSPCESAPPN